MNERIREFMVNASSGACYDGNEPVLYGTEIEKFAELLIRECAEQVKNLRVNDCGISGAEIIREHFGVE